MRYEHLPPPDQLKDYIRFIWVLHNDNAGAPLKTFKTIADGCPGLIFQNSEEDQFYQNNKQLPRIFLYGQATTYAQISLGKSSTIGMYFYPNAFRAIFGFNADALTNSCLDIALLSSSHYFYLLEHLLNTTSVAHQIGLLSAYLFSQISQNYKSADSLVNYAVSQIIKTKGTIPVKQLQTILRLTERSLERKFKQSVGISPKLFCRICRFQAALSQVRKNGYDKLSDIAYENEYADQSHFIREFKEFTGLTPYQYQKQTTQETISFPELIR